MSWEFKPGMKVVCVDDACLGGNNGEALPVKGEIYTVREVIPDYPGHGLCIRLEEVRNHYTDYDAPWTGMEAAFKARRFRPLQEKPDSIEIFRSIASGGSITERGDHLDTRKTEDIFAIPGRPILRGAA